MPNPYDHLRQTDDDTFSPYRLPNLNANLYHPNAIYPNGVSQFHGSLNAESFAFAAVNNAQRRCVEASLFGSIEPIRDEKPPEVSVCNSDLWKRFNKVGTEMIITKTGRRMFPTIKINVKNLDENAKYVLAMDVVPVDDNRYKYHDNRWIVTGKAEPHLRGSPYIHPDSPCTGNQWMRQGISFHKMKVTNNPITPQGQILLNSMHKYRPRLHIFRYSDVIGYQWHSVNSYTFQDTDFIGVTAYQNEQVTQLKIDNNPFAKGFREGNHSRRDRAIKRDHHGNNIQSCNAIRISDEDEPAIKRSCMNSVHDSTANHRLNYPQQEDSTSYALPIPRVYDNLDVHASRFQHDLRSHMQNSIPNPANYTGGGNFFHPSHLQNFFNGFHNFGPAGPAVHQGNFPTQVNPYKIPDCDYSALAAAAAMAARYEQPNQSYGCIQANESFVRSSNSRGSNRPIKSDHRSSTNQMLLGQSSSQNNYPVSFMNLQMQNGLTDPGGGGRNVSSGNNQMQNSNHVNGDPNEYFDRSQF